MDDCRTKRLEVLQQMNNMENMQLGRLTEEFRKHEVKGRIQVTGSYYKYQQWRDGKNVTTRVKPGKAEALLKGIEGLDQLKRLSAEFVEATVAMTDLDSQEDVFSKKTPNSPARAVSRNRTRPSGNSGSASRSRAWKRRMD